MTYKLSKAQYENQSRIEENRTYVSDKEELHISREYIEKATREWIEKGNEIKKLAPGMAEGIVDVDVDFMAPITVNERFIMF